MSRCQPPPELFLDRSLGRHRVAAGLRAAGWTVRSHHAVYGERDESVTDVEWIEYCGRERLPVLSKDKRLRYRPAEIAAIRRFRVCVFTLVRGHLRAEEQIERFLTNGDAIAAQALKPGPAVHAVHARRVEQLFP